MDINDYIRPDPEKFVKESERILEEIKKLMAAISAEPDDNKRKELSKKIQEKANYLSALAILEEKKEGKEKIDIFMEVMVRDTPYSDGTRKIALHNCKKLLDNLFSRILFDVECVKKYMDSLKREMRSARIEAGFESEIMNDIYAKLKELSNATLDIVLTSRDAQFFRAEIAIGYFSLIPDVGEKELGKIGQKLLSRSRDYGDIVGKYLFAAKGARFIAKKDEFFFGIYDGEICFIKVLRIDLEKIVCKVSLANLETILLGFDPVTGKSSDKKGILWKNLADMESMDPKIIKPEADELPEHSKTVPVLYRTKNDEEKIGIGYYNFKRKDWTIIERNAIGVFPERVISWFEVPEEYKNSLSGYKL